MDTSKFLVALIGLTLFACADDGARSLTSEPETATATGTATDDLRGPLPSEVSTAPAPSVMTIVSYDGTKKYEAYPIDVAVESDVSATVSATVANREVLAWIVNQAGRVFAATPRPAASATLSARLTAGRYYLMFRDASQQPATMRIQVLVTPVTVPPPPPPPGQTSLLLPPGKNGAAAKLVVTGTVRWWTPTLWDFQLDKSIGSASAIGSVSLSCDGTIQERQPAGGIPTLEFVRTACNTQSSTSTSPGSIATAAAYLDGWADGFARAPWYYDAASDSYKRTYAGMKQSIEIGPTKASFKASLNAGWTKRELCPGYSPQLLSRYQDRGGLMGGTQDCYIDGAISY